MPRLQIGIKGKQSTINMPLGEICSRSVVLQVRPDRYAGLHYTRDRSWKDNVIATLSTSIVGKQSVTDVVEDISFRLLSYRSSNSLTDMQGSGILGITAGETTQQL